MIVLEGIAELKSLIEKRKAFPKHRGRPGKVGGSLPKGQGTSPIHRRNPPIGEGQVNAVESKKVKKPVTREWANNVGVAALRDVGALDALNVWAKDKWGSTDLVEYLRDAFEVEIDGFHSVIKSIGILPHSLDVLGRIYDASGNDVGYFERYFTPDNKGVDHDAMVIDEDARNKGFGHQFYKNAEEAYINMGVKRVELFANIDVGGYAWARMGYDFVDDSDQRRLQEMLFDVILDNYGHDEADKVDPYVVTSMHSWDIANYAGPDGKQLGKTILLGSSWYGYKDLSEDSLGRKVGEAYYASKAKNA